MSRLHGVSRNFAAVCADSSERTPRESTTKRPTPTGVAERPAIDGPSRDGQNTLSGSDALKPRCGVGLEDAKARPSGTAERQSLSSPAAQPPLLNLDHVFREVGRRFLKCILFGLMVASASAQNVELRLPSPTPICFNITTNEGVDGLFMNAKDAAKYAAKYGIKYTASDSRPMWSLSSPEMMQGAAKPHNDPHEVELYFTGRDGSKWKAVKWERSK